MGSPGLLAKGQLCRAPSQNPLFVQGHRSLVLTESQIPDCVDVLVVHGGIDDTRKLIKV